MLLIALSFLTGFCSLMYELALAQLLSSLLGNTVFRYATTLAVYTLALGLGSILYKPSETSRDVKLFLRAELALALIGLLAPALFVGGYALSAKLIALNVHSTVTTLVLHFIIALIGFASGFELPILSHLAEKKLGKLAPAKILASDYVGMFAASLTFPLVLFPAYGVFTTIWITTLINLAAVVVTIFSLNEGGAKLASKTIYSTLILLTGVNALVLVFSHQVSEFFSWLYAQV